MNYYTKLAAISLGLLSVVGVSNLRAEEATMIQSDQPKADAVQVPDSTMVPKSASSDTMADSSKQNIELSTFVRLLNAADLSSELSSHKEVTIFAPSNAAFEKLSSGTVEDLTKPENKDKLKALLLFHIIPGKYMKADAKSANVKTLNGKNVEIVVKDGKVTVNGSNVISGDIVGQNGVIHVIDNVNQP